MGLWGAALRLWIGSKMPLLLAYPFSAEDVQKASEEWGCNCGPTALAFACQMPLQRARETIPGFERKFYTSPTMMKAALASLGREYESISKPVLADVFDSERVSLVRVQWCGPWTKEGSNPRWAYHATHWIAAWERGSQRYVFDGNCGTTQFERWHNEIVPQLTALHKRADGRWFATHVWRLA